MIARVLVHPTAEVSREATVAEGTRIWNHVQVREGARIGKECNIGTGAYIDRDVLIGDRVKVQNRASLYRGVIVEDGVFIGPHVAFTNDRHPRSVFPDGLLRGDSDWEPLQTRVREGASIGAHVVVVCGVTIGRWAMVGAGAVVTKDVADHALVAGNPARVIGCVCFCGRRVQRAQDGCGTCGWRR